MKDKVAGRRLRAVSTERAHPSGEVAVREAYWARVRALRDERERLRAG